MRNPSTPNSASTLNGDITVAFASAAKVELMAMAKAPIAQATRRKRREEREEEFKEVNGSDAGVGCNKDATPAAKTLHPCRKVRPAVQFFRTRAARAPPDFPRQWRDAKTNRRDWR